MTNAIDPNEIRDTGEVMPTRQAPTELSVSDAPKPKVEKDTEPKSYVHLADGTVLKCKNSDLPIGSGDAPYGHWQRGNNVYLIIGVYPVEDTVEE